MPHAISATLYLRVCPLLAAMVLACLCPGSYGAEPRTGLVLSGGGARGVAHVGVIKALEELQVPVHAIAATSMGSLVGGLYATGMSAEDLQHVIGNMQWGEAFLDKPDREDMPVRRKQDDYDYPVKLHFALKDGRLRFPLGVVQGQRATFLLKNLVAQAEHIRDFDDFYIPFRAVAADVETGEAYVFSRGDLVLAMRTSMSLPAIFAPVEHDGRLLVDGGIANNLPMDIARSMGVDRLIVVDIGTPLSSRDEITSVLAVTSQMITLLTRNNTTAQLATLTKNDILLTPDLEGVGTLDFDQYLVAYERGYQAAIALTERLQTLAVNDEQWAAYVDARPSPAAYDPIIQFIAIDNDSRVADELIEVRLRQKLGEPLDRQQLEQDIGAIYGLDYFENIEYQLLTEAGTTGLQITLKEKSWGTDNLKLGLNLANDLDTDSVFNLGVSYRQKGLNRLGAEWLVRGQLGNIVLLDSEFYQPLDVRSRYFLKPYLGYIDYDVYVPRIGQEATSPGSWRVRRAIFELNGGINVFGNSQIETGLFRNTGDYRVDIGSAALGDGGFNEGGWSAKYTYDNLDAAFFPTRGGFLYAQYDANRTELGADADFDRWQLQALAAMSFGAQRANTLIISGRTLQSHDALNEPQNFYQLGGLFNLSGYAQNVLSGRQLLFGMLQYQRRLTRMALSPFAAPAYVGMSLEKGNLWQARSDLSFGDLRGSGSIYLALDSPIGPLYLAYGRSGGQNQAVYLSLGWPFYSQDNFRR